MKNESNPSYREEVDPKWRIGIVHASYYKEEVTTLVRGAEEALHQAGIAQERILIIEAAGSFEIPLIGAALAKAKQVDALIGIGIIVEGETHHARLLSEQVAAGMMNVQIEYQLPFAFEVLHVNSLAQAQERSEGAENKGAEAAYAVLHSLAALNRIRGSKN